jgi:membrane protein
MWQMWRLLKKSFLAWANENALEWGAALAYYTAFSMAPLLLIALSIVGLFYQADSLAYIHARMASLVGSDAATVLTTGIKSIRSSQHGAVANIIGVSTLLVGASTVFSQLQTTLNRIWGVKPRAGHFWRDLLKQRLISFAMVVGIGFLLLVSLILSAILAAITDYFQYLLPGADFFWHVLDVGLSISIITVLFALIFKTVPDVHLSWRDVWLGAVVTTVLFVIGKTAISFYLGRSGVESVYGAAGSLLVILSWVYYSSQILFFGAEFTKIHALERRSRVLPIQGAEAVSKGAKYRERPQPRQRSEDKAS